MITLRTPSTDSDLLSLMALARELHAASEWSSLPFDDTKSFEEILTWSRRGHHDPDAFVRVAVHDYRVVGLLAGEIQRPFFSQARVAYDHIHYVVGDARHLRVGPRLVRAFTDWAATRGASAVMVSVTSGPNRRMDRFMSRWGFRPVGSNYRKDLADVS